MGRAPCCDKNNVKRGSWSPEEDATLKNYLQNNGTGGNWISLPQRAGLRRCGKSCRLRWLNYLRPDIKHGAFTEEEDNIIISMYYKMGSRWSVIATNLPGRTDNDVKNHWNTKLKKKLFAGSNNNNKINLTIPKFNNNNNNNNLNFTNNNIINPIFQLPPNYNYSNTNQVHNHQVYVPNPSFSDLLSHCTNSTSMSLLPNDPFSNPISTRYPFNQTLMMPQASSSITNVDNVNVYTHEEVSSGSKSSSIVYGSGFDDDPFLSDLEFGLMQEEVVMDNPECNFDVGHEDIKPQGLGQGVVNN